MKRVFVFGCGELFCEKQKALLKEYEVIGIYDNFKTGKYELCNGNVVPIVLPLKENISKYSIVIMRSDFVTAWNELSELGVEWESVIFPHMVQPLFGYEKQLFSNNERLVIENGVLTYYDQWNEMYFLTEENTYKEMVKKVLWKNEREIYDSSMIIKNCPLKPLNRVFGFSRGMPINRYYIEKFLEEKREFICGDVLEVAENTYTKKFGLSVTNSYMLHVSSEDERYIKGNFETGEGIIPESVDCIILTQVLPVIFDSKAVISNICRMLKTGGVCLITVNGISQISRYDMERWGDYWNFTDLSIRKLLEKEVSADKIEIRTYGNVKTATAMLYGVAAEELSKEELDYVDEDYQVSICAMIRK